MLEVETVVLDALAKAAPVFNDDALPYERQRTVVLRLLKVHKYDVSCRVERTHCASTHARTHARTKRIRFPGWYHTPNLR